MTSKFRRNNIDKKINLLQKEHDSILSEITHIENETDNNSIMDIINPVYKDLDMNNNNIINVDNIFMKDNLVLESVGIGTCDITMTNDIKQINSRITSNNTQLTIETIDDNRLVLKAQDSDYVVIDPDNTLYPDSITLLSTVKIGGDIKTNNIFNIGDIQTSTVNGGTILTNPLTSSLDCNNNNIINVNDIQTSTVNGSTILTNPLSSSLDCNNNSILNITEIKTTGQQLRIIGSPLVLENELFGTDILISNRIDMSGGDIKNVNDIKCTTVNTQVINVDYIATNNTNNIDINAILGSLELKGLIIKSHTDIDMKNNDLLNVSNITSNVVKTAIIDGLSPNIGVIKNLDMATRQILNCSRINRASGSLIIDGQEVIINNLSTIGNVLSPVTYTSDIDMNQYNLLNVGTLEVNEIKDHVIYKNLISGNEIKYNGRVNVKITTTSTAPVLLFRIAYLHNCSVYEGRLMSTNYTQNKIWTCPAVCVVNDNVIDKNIGGSGISSIGGTTRSATIDFIIGSNYLEGYITASFTDETVSVFEFSVWSDLY